ncbi:hypothetical protein [Actinoplanes auranticolor]|uniref:Uncharacterized protein n=1 Tax=Actinoplanes auranticolor TaxID=47988 RepID=A0A919VGG0_9ACTN|nr:hypothetical protein [Actinoplanes auranticolor]GIM63833.1 hypothetical protein Aau02nite_06640 [Actinoplanes auranticolor]
MKDAVLAPHIAGPLMAMAAVVATMFAHWLAVSESGRWAWRTVTAWAIPAATTIGMLTVVFWKGEEFAGNIASTGSLIVSVIVATVGNGAQYLLVARARSAGSVDGTVAD